MISTHTEDGRQISEIFNIDTFNNVEAWEFSGVSMGVGDIVFVNVWVPWDAETSIRGPVERSLNEYEYGRK